jgi:hypothetical protein
MKIELPPGETKTDTCPILYILQDESRYNGKRTITDK